MARKAKIKNSIPAKNRTKFIAIFIITIAFTVVGASLTSWLSAQYFNDYYSQGKWIIDTCEITGAMSLTSTLLSWVSFLIMAGSCCAFYNVVKNRNLIRNIRLLKKLLQVILVLSVLSAAAQVCSSICLCQYGAMKDLMWLMNSKQIYDTNIVAPVMNGCAMIASIVLLVEYKMSTNA